MRVGSANRRAERCRHGRRRPLAVACSNPSPRFISLPRTTSPPWPCTLEASTLNDELSLGR